MPSIINATTTNGLVTSADNSGSLQLQTNNGTTAVTIDTSQNVGVGTTTINDRLVVQSSSAEQGITIRGDGLDAIKIGMVNPSVSNDGVIGMKINNALRFITNNTERMRIDASGRLLVNRTTANAQMCLTYAGNSIEGFNINDSASSAGSAAIRFAFGGTGCGGIVLNTNSTTYQTSSDYRLKEDIAPMIGALDKVAQLKPVTYKWKADGSKGQGFIAHELQAVVPECVTGKKDDVETYTDEEGNEQTRIKPQGIDTSFLVATLTAAIQELKAELDATKAEVQALKGVA